jgi:hypothetical protein
MASRLVLLLQRCRPPLLQQGTLQCSQLTLSGSTRDLGMKEGNVHAAPTCDTNMQWVNQKVVIPFKTSCSRLTNDAIASALTAGVVGGIVRPPPPPPSVSSKF